MNIFQFLKWKRGREATPPKLSAKDQEELVAEFEKKFHLHFNQPELIITALKHRSYLNITNEDRIFSNERLEFLGDAVLDLVVTHYLYEKFPKRTEGELSKIKSILVSKPVLADVANQMSLGNFVLINWGEEKTGGRKRQSILADAMEAIIGAIYLDQGLEAAREFIQTHLLKNFQKIIKRGLYKNYKSILLEFAQSKGLDVPSYRVVREEGPDHAKEFIIEVYVDDQKMGEGRGRSKKIAEQQAARQAVKKLKLDKK